MGIGLIRRLATALLLGGLELFGCVKAAEIPADVRRVENLSEAQAAVGKTVQVTGIAQRQKLGDALKTPSWSVLCQGVRLPEGLIGKSVTVTGQLERTDQGAATVGPNGEISQGTEPGTSYWVLRACIRH